MTVRINGLDTHYMYRDVIDVVAACERLDMILIPKVGVAADVYAVDMLVTQVESAARKHKRVGFEVLIETALGLANVEAIAQSSRAPGGTVFRGCRLCRFHPRAHDSHRRRTCRFGRARRAKAGAERAVLLDRSMACRADAHAGGVSGVRAATDRRAVR